ncbi:hypothetical protein PHYPO_G00001580 [Pangasianodon hypophthalmus]|uniref:Collagen IV NC1 domain-containing protein n=1 Tax=Pangasianodon hypophthalmus TaxID=310915 RepID=A0A5N5Q5K5_PANHP|nr:hypothetical protein PHYPO_G00001580 [Pangasianodon hypophthalmus]
MQSTNSEYGSPYLATSHVTSLIFGPYFVNPRKAGDSWKVRKSGIKVFSFSLMVFFNKAQEVHLDKRGSLAWWVCWDIKEVKGLILNTTVDYLQMSTGERLWAQCPVTPKQQGQPGAPGQRGDPGSYSAPGQKKVFGSTQLPGTPGLRGEKVLRGPTGLCGVQGETIKQLCALHSLYGSKQSHWAKRL